MTTLFMYRGLPGCGKTTDARKRVAVDPRRRARVNRDDIGAQLHGERLYNDRDLMQDTEKAITVAQHAQIRELLKRGIDVYCDDTNLVRRYARDLRRVATLAGADFEIIDMLDVPLEVAFKQNQNRAGTPAFVPEDAIRRMHQRHTGRNAYEVPLAPEAAKEVLDEPLPYAPVPGTPKAIMVDIDGTVALMQGRSPFDQDRVHEDLPNEAVITAVRAMQQAGHKVIFCSGRTDACYDATKAWIEQHVQVPFEGLFMRKHGDGRADSVAKIEIFDEHIRYNYDVVAVFDDREQVVAAWRKIGLTVFAVAEGKF